MLLVYKYQLEIQNKLCVLLPEGAKPLRFDMQDNSLCLWALVDPSKPPQPNYFTMLGTGLEVETVGEYINTMYYEYLVFHFFRS